MTFLTSVTRNLGAALRESGQALERLGVRLQGQYAYEETLNRHRRVSPFADKYPQIEKGTFVAPNATVLGDVSISSDASVWYGAVIRGDVNHVKIGPSASIQDRAVIHVAKIGGDFPTLIGARAVVEPGAIVHAATLKDGAFVGAGAKVLDGAVVGEEAMVAAGALVTPGTKIPDGQLWSGSPAKFERDLSAQEKKDMRAAAEKIVLLAKKHQAEAEKPFDVVRAERIVREAEEERHQDYVSKIGYSQ
ncbi:mitochondrial Complex I (CI) NADH:ubiquinone oxidoreductase subunit gamma carbonic anhydrase 2 [Andalucia godoyi]|uniref:Mitochondrial Complex I (CI) NADH:ubiquinone oxidoreductase subunit gamma carbonic anhydrase 2 n=1 Tax=Andalucia godoyi TaxID=505711 RepID=A0A8K0AIG2_ANDGO|nr:mitochondrial Complex I (CI) NADH:ubiquinone oxidoreductase subunit gamma carbonic anhydrase 2 [Andalucia godoyi]|eukprot:ANDGO_00766.mRNA.1 mitochondrial Complex I (CI) NADH:ubiquinone oxidoreductase subunit gamma carbonic anhydrase 2 (gamma CA2 Type I)